MKKPYREEKAGLKIEPGQLSLLIFFFFFTGELFPQVPINGFCKYNSFAAPQGYNSLFSLNYNNDSYTDVVLYNPLLKKITAFTGGKNGTFEAPRTYRLPFEITSIQNLIERNKVIKRYAFVSRQNRRAGIYSFTSYGRAILTTSVKFDSYPGHISAADINRNGRDELLISGSAFNGLTLLSQAGYDLKKKKISDGTSYSSAIFADLNNDGFGDIAAFNAITNSLVFFYNDGEDGFRLVRTIPMNEQIRQLRSLDINLDNYADLIFSKGKSIEIMYGDFQSSYSKIIDIPTEYYPDQIITGDFNRDGKIDLAYVNYEEGTLSVLFGKGEYSFYPEMVYLKKEALKMPVPFYSRFINGIACVSDSGSIYTLTNLPAISENVSISTSPEPSALSFFDHNNNGIIDICYIDNFTRSLDLIVRNNAGIPSLYYSFPLFKNHKKIIVDNAEPTTKSFYCFTPGKKLIEILKFDFKTNKLEREALYSPGDITDLKIKKLPDNKADIFIAYEKSGNLGLSIIEYHDYRYTFNNVTSVDSDTYAPTISLRGPLKVLYWKRENGGYDFYSYNAGNGPAGKSLKFSLRDRNVESLVSFTGDLLSNDKDITISFIQRSGKNSAFISSEKNAYMLKGRDIPDYFKVNSSSQIYCGELRFNGIKKLCVNLPGSNSISRVDFINRGRDISVSKITEAKDVGSYFIKNMSFRNYHLVFTNDSTGCITIKQL